MVGVVPYNRLLTKQNATRRLNYRDNRTGEFLEVSDAIQEIVQHFQD